MLFVFKRIYSYEHIIKLKKFALTFFAKLESILILLINKKEICLI